MPFGSGAIFAIVMSSMAGSAGHAPAAVTSDPGRADPWTVAPVTAPASTPRTAPLPSVDLTLRMPHEQFDMKSLIPKHPPIEVKSMKVVGASGIGIYFPGRSNVAVGVGITAFKVAPEKRALQTVFGLRFRF